MIRKHFRERGVGYVGAYLVWLGLLGTAILADGDLAAVSKALFTLLITGIGLLGGVIVFAVWFARATATRRQSHR